MRVVGGVLGGMTFVFVSKKYLEDYEDLTIGDIKGLEAAKMLLIVGVMTLHSFAVLCPSPHAPTKPLSSP